LAAPALAYNPDDPVQTGFLAALAQGETGNSAFASTEGVGGVNLAGSPTDQYGFPQWAGEGNSHAAGTYQFQPGTWQSIASQFGLNFSSPSDQSAGAWYLAEQTYAQNTGGQSLETALQSGDYSSVQSALAAVWPSVTGNAAAPTGLSGTLGAVAAAPSGALATTGATTAAASGATGTGSTGLVASIENFFVRFGLIVVGGIVVVVALWLLLSSGGIVPSPRQTLRAIV